MATDHQVHTMNLSDDGDGMVPLYDNPSTSFTPEKNVGQSKETMDSTLINDIMMEPPMMNEEPRMQGVMPQMTAPNPRVLIPPLRRLPNLRRRTPSTSLMSNSPPS